MTTPRICDLYGLHDHDAAALTGWTRRVAQACAHLAEAWCIADDTNAPHAVLALAAMLQGMRASNLQRIMFDVIASAAGGSLDAGGRGTELVEQVQRLL